MHGRQWQRSLARYAFPTIGHLDIRAIGIPEVLTVLEQRLSLDDGRTGKFWGCAVSPPTVSAIASS